MQLKGLSQGWALLGYSKVEFKARLSDSGRCAFNLVLDHLSKDDIFLPASFIFLVPDVACALNLD